MKVGIILIGESNSGKSTIGYKILERLRDMKYISSGDIARSMAKSEANKRLLNLGNLAPENIMRSKIREEIDCDKSFILDGFPRFTEQYEWLKKNTNHMLLFVNVLAPYNLILRRAKSRGREDDCSILKKHEFYTSNVLPMLEHMRIVGEDIYSVSTADDETVNEFIDELISAVKVLKEI